jgi:uncharacterized protein YjiS (DUF1127 family)
MRPAAILRDRLQAALSQENLKRIWRINRCPLKVLVGRNGHVAHRGSPSKEIAMTMLNNTSTYVATAQGVRRGAAIFLARLGRLINRWIAAMIARREREAALAMLRHLSDRDLKDIGICRGDIGDALAERAEARSRMQRPQRS